MEHGLSNGFIVAAFREIWIGASIWSLPAEERLNISLVSSSYPAA